MPIQVVGPLAAPNVKGITQQDAEEQINALYLVFTYGGSKPSSTVTKGDIADQFPPAGTLVDVGSVIVLFASSGPFTLSTSGISARGVSGPGVSGPRVSITSETLPSAAVTADSSSITADSISVTADNG